MTVIIRPEQPDDIRTIHDLTALAFAPMPFSNGSEPNIIDALRRDGDLTLSLVAVDQDRLFGHIAISPITISDGTKDWYGLGPVSVTPEHQRSGIGSQLIQRAIADILQIGARGIVLLGSNEYYPRFGFEHRPQLTYTGPPAEYFQCLKLSGEWPTGEVRYAPGFG